MLVLINVRQAWMSVHPFESFRYGLIEGRSRIRGSGGADSGQSRGENGEGYASRLLLARVAGQPHVFGGLLSVSARPLPGDQEVFVVDLHLGTGPFAEERPIALLRVEHLKLAVFLPSGNVAGAGGFEPPDGGIKIRCLTTWLRPNAPRG